MSDIQASRPPHWKSAMSALPAIGLAVLPKLTCSACWPLHSALLSSLGLGLVDRPPDLLPLTILLLVLSFAPLAYRAGGRRAYKPFYPGLVAAIIVAVRVLLVLRTNRYPSASTRL